MSKKRVDISSSKKYSIAYYYLSLIIRMVKDEVRIMKDDDGGWRRNGLY